MKGKTFTQKDEFGRNYLDGTSGKLSSDILGRFYGEAIDRLAELENNDEKDIERERIIKLIQDAVDGCARYWAQLIADNLLANGVRFIDKSRFIELPCKVGDKVYRLKTSTEVGKCIGCEYYFPGGMGDGPSCEKTTIGSRPPECIEIEEITVTLKDIYFWLYMDDFNKNVFHTREEAEKELEERKQGNGKRKAD